MYEDSKQGCIHSFPACPSCQGLSRFNGGNPPTEIRDWYYASAQRGGDPVITKIANDWAKAEYKYDVYRRRETNFLGRLFNRITGNYGDSSDI